MLLKINCLLTSDSIELKGLNLLINNQREIIGENGQVYWIKFDAFYEAVTNSKFTGSREPEILKECVNELIRIYKDSEIIVNNVRCKIFNSINYKEKSKEFEYTITEGAKILFKLVYIEIKTRNNRC